ncbi:50S ribosomal protein L29 [Mycoplasmopsis caviae]|uniref:Large ribosomal subunit protein uL29 n=1 Tax=Mycoplasmopsis caviae TaxID=55603 RepID=A0A3P8KCM5_9BACT|nr:50S ribosomal protein L29 [Mycoplasmopsis caviae]UUD34868.1 50S ribosomal protein L29 [Mycoplasmopsis caviae]VDR42284.1 50S ribosomal protein L29 [Mycoplasmopsis caviae]
MLYKDIKVKSNAELRKLLEDLKAQLFIYRFQNKTGVLDHSHKIREVRRDIARVLTILKINETKGEAK